MLPPSAWAITDHLMDTGAHAAPAARPTRTTRAAAPQRRFRRRRRLAFA